MYYTNVVKGIKGRWRICKDCRTRHTFIALKFTCTGWEAKSRRPYPFQCCKEQRILLGGPSPEHQRVLVARSYIHRDEFKQTVLYRSRDGASAKAKGPSVFSSASQGEPNSPAFFHMSPCQRWRSACALISEQMLTFFRVQKWRRRSHERGKSRDVNCLEGPSIPSLQTNIPKRPRTGIRGSSLGRARLLAYFHLRPVRRWCHVHQFEGPMA